MSLIPVHLWNYEPHNEGPAHSERLIVHYEGLGAHNGTNLLVRVNVLAFLPDHLVAALGEGLVEERVVHGEDRAALDLALGFVVRLRVPHGVPDRTRGVVVLEAPPAEEGTAHLGAGVQLETGRDADGRLLRGRGLRVACRQEGAWGLAP